MPVFLEALVAGDVVAGRGARGRDRPRRLGGSAIPTCWRSGCSARARRRSRRGDTGRGMRPARRGHGRRHRRRGLAHPHRHRLLRRDRSLHGCLRPATRRRMDRGAERLVHGPAGPRALPRPVPRAPGADPAGARRVGRGASPRRSGRVRSSPTPSTRRSASRSTSWASCTGCAASRPTPNARTGPPLEHGREPAPGMALLRLARGKGRGGRRCRAPACCEESGGPATECAVRAAAVEILLAAGDLAGARTAADELVRAADRDGRSAAPRHGRRRPRCGAAGAGRRGRRPRRAAARVREVARAGDALRRGAGAGPDRPGVPRAGRPGRRRARAGRRAGTFERLGARPDLARVARLAGRRHRGRPSSPSASARCCVWSRRAEATGRSRPSWSSARTPSPGTCRTSSPRPGCPRAPPPPPTPTSTTCV